MAWLASLALPAAFVLAAACIHLVQAGNTNCVSNQLNWYLSIVGESPCTTYQRLRQICNNDYQVGSFRRTVPGDQCDDQVSECCCNPVAWQLSMLCMVCQQDTQDDGGIGIDAPKTSWGNYSGSCGNATNNVLPSDIQAAVCNENIRVNNFLYHTWDDGSWFYVWTKENAERDHAANANNTFTHCPGQISSSSSTTIIASVTSSTRAIVMPTSDVGLSSSSSSSVPTQSSDAVLEASTRSKSYAPVIGGVVGGVMALVVLVLEGFLLWQKRKINNEGFQGMRERPFSYNPQPSFTAGAPSLFSWKRLAMQGFLISQTRTSESGGYRSDTETWGSASDSYPTETYTSPRHGDGGSLSGLARSASGRLPPAYTSSSIDEHQRRTAAASVSISAFDFAGSEVSATRQTIPSLPAVPQSVWSDPATSESHGRSVIGHPPIRTAKH